MPLSGHTETVGLQPQLPRILCLDRGLPRRFLESFSICAPHSQCTNIATRTHHWHDGCLRLAYPAHSPLFL